jgi:hypothetical protein
MQVQIVKDTECFLCNQSMSIESEVELVLDEPQHDARIVYGDIVPVLITARYFCSDAHADEYKQWLDNHKREVSNESLLNL